jgi:hypothetical protein
MDIYSMGLTITRKTKNGFLNYTLEKADDILDYLNQDSLNPYIKVIEPLRILIEDLIAQNSTFTFKKFNHLIRSCFHQNANSRLSKEFWFNRGYTEEDTILKIKQLQSTNSLTYANKRREKPEVYFESNPNRKEYWMKKNYSEEEAQKIIKKRQSRNLEYYQKKYGNDQGLEKYKDRNERWLYSINRSRGITWDSNSTSLAHSKYQERYGEEWLLVKIKHTKNKKRRKLLSIIHDIVYVQKKDLYLFFLNSSVENVFELSKESILMYLVKFNHFELMSNWMFHNKVDRIKRGEKYGYVYYIGGKYYQSTGEYLIGSYLEAHNISFELHKRYKGTNRVSDFYINELDLYVELTGMPTSTYELKRKQLAKTTYKIIWSSDHEHIIRYIDEKIHRKQKDL